MTNDKYMVRTLYTGINSYCYKWMLNILQVSTILSIWHHYKLNDLVAKISEDFFASLIFIYFYVMKAELFCCLGHLLI